MELTKPTKPQITCIEFWSFTTSALREIIKDGKEMANNWPDDIQAKVWLDEVNDACTVINHRELIEITKPTKPHITNAHFWSYTTSALRYIAKDAKEAADHWTDCDKTSVWLDEANDACTVINYRMREDQ